jgi:polysaccharide export outer membrane protein
MKYGFSGSRLAFAALAIGLSTATLSAQSTTPDPNPATPASTTTPVVPAATPMPATGAAVPDTATTQNPAVNPPASASPSSGVTISNGQSPNPAAGSQPDPLLKINPEKAARDFQPAANAEYELGAGDEITVNAPGRAEITGKQTIGPDGRISLSLIGPIRVADMTRSDAAKAIQDALSSYYTNLSVTVSVDKYVSNKVRVVGYVLKPGEVQFEGTPTLLDAISRAGLISSNAISKDGTVTPTVGGNGIPETCTIYRNTSTDGAPNSTAVIVVQLREYLTSGNALADMRLKRNDIIFVPDPSEKFVSVIGEVNKPGTVPINSSSTLTSVLSMAGGLNESAGNAPNIRIIQPTLNKEITVPYKQLLSLSGQKEFAIHPGDVIVINKSGFYKATYVLQRISPIATMVSLAALVF